jgi:transposase-like protein
MTTLSELAFDEKHLEERWSHVKDDFWSDIKVQTLKALKKLLETSLDVEMNDLVNARPFQRSHHRKGWRNGHYLRGLATSFGEIPDLEVPRLRKGTLSFKVLPRYQRRAPDVNRNVLEMFLAGVSTRRIREVLSPLMGPYALSAQTVSRISQVLNNQVQGWHRRFLTDRYNYLILDGIYLKAKNPLRSTRRCILVAYGLTLQGDRELIDFRLASHGESQVAWEVFLGDLRRRGLEGKSLKLSVVDGNKGLWNALEMVYPDCPRQRCWAHKLRNVANLLPRRFQSLCTNGAREIYDAPSHVEALKAFRHWKRVWNPIKPEAVACLERDLGSLLVFYRACPQDLRKKLRTTNVIERVFREVRRRTRPMSCFENTQSVERIVFAIFNRQNRIWREKPLVTSTQKT